MQNTRWIIKHGNSQRPLPVFRIILLFIFIGMPSAQAHLFSEDNKPARVLVLYPFFETRDWDFEFGSGLLDRFNEQGSPDISISFEYMKTGLIPDVISLDDTLELLRVWDAIAEPDFIVSIFPSVHNILAEYGPDIFPGKPIIFVPVIHGQAELLLQTPDSYVIESGSEIAVRQTLTSITNLMPSLNTLFIISGSGNDDLFYLNNFKRLMAESEPEYRTEYIIGMPLNMMQTKLAELPGNSAVMYLPFNRDLQGNAYRTSQLFPVLTDAANAPVFSFFDSAFGLGVVGGEMTSADIYARKTASMIIEMMNGEKVTSHIVNGVTRDIYDWRQLERWNFDEKNLLTGSAIHFKSVSFFEQYQTQIILVNLFISVETILIVLLILNINKRRMTESLLKRSERTAKLGGFVYDIEKDILTHTKEVQQLLGLNRNETLSSESIINQLRPTDRQDFLAMLEKLKTESNSCVETFQVVRKNGDTVWIEFRGETIKTDGITKRIAGTIRDISIEKEYELELKDSMQQKDILLKEVHHRVKNNLAIITSLLSIQTNTIADEKYKKILLSIHNRILTMALLHEDIYIDGDLESIHLPTYLEHLIHTIVSNSPLYPDRITIDSEIIEVCTNINHLMPLGLIINEVVSNSLEHAYMNTENPELSIKTNYLEAENLYTIVISDNGCGLPDLTLISNSDTIGFMLISNLVKQIDGTITTKNEDGVSIIITFPPGTK